MPIGHVYGVVTILLCHRSIPDWPLPVPGEGWVTPVEQPCRTCRRESQEDGGGGSYREPDVLW